MAGAQPMIGRPQNITSSPEHPTYYVSPSQSESRSSEELQNGGLARDVSAARGRGPGPSLIVLQSGAQQVGRAPSPRLQPRSAGGNTRAVDGVTVALERKHSGTNRHHRQTSIVHGVPQHGRSASLALSPSPASISPQNLAHTMRHGMGLEPTNLHPQSIDTGDLRSIESSPSTANGSISGYSTTSTLLGDRDGVDSGIMLTQRRVDRMHSGKTRRDHSHQRSHSKPPQPSEQRSVGEYALHHLFNSFVGQADFKINQCVSNLSSPEPRVEDVCGPGVDPEFDQLISALGHIARQKPKPLIDTIMFWRKAKGEAANAAKSEMNQSKTSSPAQRMGAQAMNLAEPTYSTSSSLQQAVIQAERRSSLSIYLLCRVLIEIYHQSDLRSITPQMAEKLEDIIFDQLQRTDAENLAISLFRFANWTIFCQLLGVMSDLNFHSVSRRFINELRIFQRDASSKSPTSKEVEERVELLVLGMRYLRIKTQPDGGWREACEFLHTLGEYFVNSHGQPIKHAYCHILEQLVLPVAASAGSQLSIPKWKDFLSMLTPRLAHMQAKPRHWMTAFPLSTLLLCASPPEVFSAQWLPLITSLQAKLKDRMTRRAALQAICRLIWTYLYRIADPVNSALRKLEDVVKIVLPSGKKSYLSTDPAFAEPIIELIRIIGFRHHEFCFRSIIFPLMNSDTFASGREIKVEQLEPEKLVIGIRAFLVTVTDLEDAETGRPPFPYFRNDSLAVDVLPGHLSADVVRNVEGSRSPSTVREDRLSRPVMTSNLDESVQDYFGRFCEILGKVTVLCDNTFGGQAALDEKFGGHTPKTPMSEAFSFSRKDEHPMAAEHRQGFYELLHVAIQALPRCLPHSTPINSLINLLCTGTAHVHSNIAISSAKSLKSIARHTHAQQVTIGFARFIFNFNARYSTMSDEGMLGPGHIENTLKLYIELLQIWIGEIKMKTRSAASEAMDDGFMSSRGVQLDLTSTITLVEEVESHGVFFLCSQSRRVRSFAVTVLGLVTEFDTALGKEFPRIIQILNGDLGRIIDSNDDRLSIAEKSRLEKGKRKSSSQNTLIELCGSDESYDATLWFKILPNLIRISFEMCPATVLLGRDIVCARLLHMHPTIISLSEGTRWPASSAFDHNATRSLTRLRVTPPEVMVEQWKMYLVMACTTLTNAGAQTQSQLANTQHARNKSKGSQQGQDKISSARGLFSHVIPLLSAGPTMIRNAIVVSLGSINVHLFRTLLESLQYAVTTCNEEAKVRIGHQRSGSSPRRNQKTDRLRTEVTHVYKLTSRFLRTEEVLRDEWLLRNLMKYTDDIRMFLSDTEVQNDWEFQKLRVHYCGLIEEVFEAIKRTNNPSDWMSFEARKSAFALMEDWCGHSPNPQIHQREDGMRQLALDQHPYTGERTNATAAMEIEKRELQTAALSAMASLCGGPFAFTTEKKTTLSFDVSRILQWIDKIFDTIIDKMHLIGRRALTNLIVHNKDYPYLLEHSIEMCYLAERPKALESYFEVVTQILMNEKEYQLAFWRILGAVLFTLGNEKSHIRTKSARLLRTLEQRQQRSSKLQDFEISISDKTTAVYKLAQFEISKRLAKQHTELAFHVFSQFSAHYKASQPDHQRNMVAAILPWVQVIELQLDPNGGPTAQTYMLLANLLEITTKSSTALHNEVQALWQALATGPHGGNVQLILDFVINLCLDRREQSFVEYAKQIVVFLSSTPAGQKVIEFLLLQINPKNMVQDKREAMEIPQDSFRLPYVADLSEALPIGNKQSGFSMGQLSLILLVDLMVTPVKLSKDSIPLLLQVSLVLWDHYTILVQEQAREMLVHLIHELVISKIEDDTSTTPKKNTIEEFVESIRQHHAQVVWTYEESNGKDQEEDGNRVPLSMTHVTNEVVNLFSLAYPNIHEQWAKTTLHWATSCPVRHLACRSFQIFRCILSSLTLPMLADMLARLSNTIADEAADIQTFSMEILTTLKTIIGALEPGDLIKYPQLFWATCACLNTTNEREFIETLEMLDRLLDKVNFHDPAVIRLLQEAKPVKWEGTFDGIVPLVYRGLKSATSLEKSLAILKKIAPLPDNELIGDQSRLLFGVLAYLPRFLHAFDNPMKDIGSVDSARILASIAESEEYQEISVVLNGFANSRYSTSKDFLPIILSTLRRSFFPRWELKSLIFLIGLLTNRISWYKLKTMEILCVIIPDIDMRRSEFACHGPDLISPLLRLLQTEYCPQALNVMDHIMGMSATPMDKHHLRMSMASSGSRTIRKEYEKTQSLYGIPEDTGWSIPMPAIHSGTTRSNVHAVFYTCASTDPAEPDALPTPEFEFHTEEFQHGSYFPLERTGTMTSEDPRADVGYDTHMGDPVSKLDSLDDFFDEDSLDSNNKYLSSYSDLTITGFDSDPDHGADLYDQQTAPILHQSLARTASITSLHNTFTDLRSGQSARDPGVMTPAAFTSGPISVLNAPSNSPASAPQLRPTLHSRSVTSPSNGLSRPSDLLSDDEVDEIFSDDERSTGNNGGPQILDTMIRRTKTTTTTKKSAPAGAAGRDYRQRDIQRLQQRARSKIQTPGSPEVPKVPELYLQQVGKTGDSRTAFAGGLAEKSFLMDP